MTTPDDIMLVAKEVVDRIAKVHVLKGDCVEDVAKAILAERERSRQLLSEAETREMEARREALGDAAEAIFVMGAWYHGFADKGFPNTFDEGTSAAYEIVRELQGKSENALQSEER